MRGICYLLLLIFFGIKVWKDDLKDTTIHVYSKQANQEMIIDTLISLHGRDTLFFHHYPKGSKFDKK